MRRTSYEIDEWRYKLDELARYKKTGKLLDIGCGHGFMLEIARELGYQVFGVEPQEPLARYAREELGLDVITGEIFEANYPDEFFDVVTMWEVLEHMPSPARALKEAFRILKSDGVLSIIVPNVESRNARTNPDWWTSYHFYHFSPDTISKILSQSGFIVQKLIVNPHISFLASSRRRQFIFKHLGWEIRAFRQILPLIHHLPIYRLSGAGITAYACKPSGR